MEKNANVPSELKDYGFFLKESGNGFLQFVVKTAQILENPAVSLVEPSI